MLLTLELSPSFEKSWHSNDVVEEVAKVLFHAFTVDF